MITENDFLSTLHLHPLPLSFLVHLFSQGFFFHFQVSYSFFKGIGTFQTDFFLIIDTRF